MSDAKKTPDDTVSLLDLIAVLARRKWLILITTAAVAVVTVLFLVVMMLIPSASKWNMLPELYRPVAKILVEDPTKGSSLSSLMSQSGLGALSGLVGGAGGKASSADLARALLASNSLRDALVSEFDLMKVLGLEKSKAPRTAARKAVGGAMYSKFDEKSGILEVGYKDMDRERATRIVNRIVDLLDHEFKRLTVDKASAKRSYLEQSVASVQAEATRLSDRLIAFQARYGIVDFTTQASENTRAIAQLQSQVVSKQMELDLQKKYVPESDSRIVKLKAELAGLQKLMTGLREGDSEFSTGPVSQKTIPALSAQYLGLKRDVEISQSTLALLKQQYELAKLESMDTSATFQVVERADVPEVRFSPGRAKTAVIATVAGFFVSVLVAFIVEYFHKAGQDPDDSQKIAVIRSQLSFRRRGQRE
jgi:tyrosine-protein kinase Etk/Wzc